MSRVHIVGQAPARSGDGRPFTGASGKRLVNLLGLEDYDELAEKFHLDNIFDQKADKMLSGRGDNFPEPLARKVGIKHMRRYAREGGPQLVLACGHKVFKALTGKRVELFTVLVVEVPIGEEEVPVHVCCFPHPSGASAYWNDIENVEIARQFLIRLQERFEHLIDQ